MQKGWNSPIYGFFEPTPIFSVVEGRECIDFICLAEYCCGTGTNQRRVRRYLDTKDKGSTGNMKRHAERCFSTKVVASSCNSNAEGVRKGVAKGLRDGTIPMSFASRGAGVVSYSNSALTKSQIRYVV